MKLLAASCVLFLTISSALAQQPEPKQGGTPLKSPEDRMSYALGATIGGNLLRQGADLNAEMVAKGLTDALAGKSQLSEEQLEQALLDFQKSMQNKAAEQRIASDPELKATADKRAKEAQDFLAENGKRKGVVTLPSGLQYQVLKSGDGPSPKPTDTITAHYHGTFPDGKVFDSSVERGQPASFPVNGVIEGWQQALPKMKVGDKWKLFVPPKLAYGLAGRPGIDPNQMLIFEVELVDILK